MSPIEILEDFNQYYKKLLGIRSAVDVGDPDAIGDLTSRFTLIVPDALTKFPVSKYFAFAEITEKLFFCLKFCDNLLVCDVTNVGCTCTVNFLVFVLQFVYLLL